MRINQFVAKATGLSRRAVDELIKNGLITVNGKQASLGIDLAKDDLVVLDNKEINLPKVSTLLLVNKPTGYVCSREGQGSKTVYDLLPAKYKSLKIAGRLDKDSSGLLVMSDDGEFINKLTHPSFKKPKRYIVALNKILESKDKSKIEKRKIKIDDTPSYLKLEKQINFKTWLILMYEGRNRQIRRTFESLGYRVTSLQRIQLGPFKIELLEGRDYLSLANIPIL